VVALSFREGNWDEEMPTIAAIDRHGQVVDSLKQMLESLSNAPMREEHCERCGALMSHVSTSFWLDGVDRAWEIQLPYCRNCHPEVGDQPSFAA
jgi:hypothetical protein